MLLGSSVGKFIRLGTYLKEKKREDGRGSVGKFIRFGTYSRSYRITTSAAQSFFSFLSRLVTFWLCSNYDYTVY